MNVRPNTIQKAAMQTMLKVAKGEGVIADKKLLRGWVGCKMAPMSTLRVGGASASCS